MRVALQTCGTDGDIRPFIALGARLVSRGHSVTLALGSLDGKDYSAMCGAVSVDCIQAPEHIEFELRNWLEEAARAKDSLPVLRLLHEQGLFPAWQAMAVAAERLCENADVAVSHFFAPTLRIAAAKRGLPSASVAFWPGLVPDAARPIEGLLPLGRFGNEGLWRLAFQMVDGAIGEGYRALYRTSGREFPAELAGYLYSQQLNLVACSTALWPDAKPAGQHRFSGYWHTPLQAESEPLPAEVEAFLSAGEPPVFLTLGSYAQVDPAGCEALLVDVAERTGLRALVQLGFGREWPRASDRICFIGRHNHATSLPRCCAALHPGGAGTTHAVLSAGLPAVIVGFHDEHQSWGRRLIRQGAGAGVFRYQTAQAAKVARALHTAALDGRLRARAGELGRQLAGEDGVGEAVRQIEALAGARGTDSPTE